MSVNPIPAYIPEGLRSQMLSHCVDSFVTNQLQTAEKAQEVCQRILQSFHVRGSREEMSSQLLKKELQFLNMFQSTDEDHFIGKIIEKTPNKSFAEALPVLRLFVLISESIPYPPQAINDALKDLWGDRVSLFAQVMEETSGKSLDGVSDDLIEKLISTSQDKDFVPRLDQWIKDLSLMSFVDSIEGLIDILDRIPRSYSIFTVEGRFQGMQFVREELKKMSFDSYDEIVLHDYDYPDHVVQSVPEEIALFTKLKTLVIMSKDIHTLPVALRACALLEGIHFQSAASNCYLPSELASLPKMKVLQVKPNIYLPEAYRERDKGDPNFSVQSLGANRDVDD